MADVNALLDAGALIPPTTKVAKPETVDAVSARSYRHIGLGDRPIVLLSPDKLAQGDDLAMEFLGFAQPTTGGPVAVQRRQALGFPGWALINDPKHARYALELVKEFKKAARRAKSKPGHAYDEFTSIGKRLNKSVAHFLPSFWEEVGREFMRMGNNTFASRAFGKAREAERVHALKVDENLRKDAFLEFALAGCLSNKSLTEYAKDLQKSHKAADAWTIYRELVVRRTLGGMPPWTSLPKEIPPLLAAAKLDVEQETAAFYAEILESRAMNRASMGFWKAASKPVQSLAAANPRVAGNLLNLIPETNMWSRDEAWVWMERLHEWNVLPNAWQDVPEEAKPNGGVASWFTRWLKLSTELPQRAFDVLRELAPRLRKEKKPIDVVVDDRWGATSMNLDLLDLALELKVPVQDPKADAEFELDDWAGTDEKVTDRHRDPIHVQGDTRFRKKLEDAVPKVAGDTDFEVAAEGKTALAEARKNWLTGVVNSALTGGLPGLMDALDTVANKTSRQTFVEFPSVYQILKNVDSSASLVRTISAGIIDEYGWPALDEVADRLDPKRKEELKVVGAFPNVVVTNGLTAVVVGPSGVVLEHELSLLKGYEFEGAMYVDGQLAVMLKKRYESKLYWSGQPKTKKERYYWGDACVSGVTIDMPDGGSFTGEKTIHAGDMTFDLDSDRFVYDGEHFWRNSWDDGESTFREIEPKKGTLGRKSMPSFFEDYIEDGFKLANDECELLKLGEFVNGSPLGSKDGFVGCRTRTRKEERQWEGIDGRSWNGRLSKEHAVHALLDQPGTKDRLPVSVNDGCYQLWSPDGACEVSRLTSHTNYNRGQAAGLPPGCWHMFQVRDVQVSKKLRAMTSKQARELLAAMQTDIEASESSDFDEMTFSKTEVAVKKWLPKLKHGRLKRGLIGVVHEAATLANTLESLLKTRDPEGQDAIRVDNKFDALIEPAMEALDVDTGWRQQGGLSANLAFAADFFTSDEPPEAAPPATLPWFDLLDNLHERVWRAYWVTDSKQQQWLDFLEKWADMPLQELPGKFRVISGEFSGKPPFKTTATDDEDERWGAYRNGENRYILSVDYGDEWTALEYAPNGKFKALPKFKADNDEEKQLERQWSSDQIRAFVACARENEKPMVELAALNEVAERIGVTAAEAGLVWFAFPGLDSWEKNFLPKTLREHLKLKVAGADAARQKLKLLPLEVRSKLLGAILDGDPAELWEENGKQALERLVAAWGDSVPKRVELPTKLADRFSSDWRIRVEVSDLMAAFATPQSHALFNTDVTWKLVDKNDVSLVSNSKEQVFDANVLHAVAISVPFMGYHLPVEDDRRTKMVSVFETTLKCLKSSKLLLELGERYLYGDDSNDVSQKLFAKLFTKINKKSKTILEADDGLVVGAAGEDEVVLAFRPAKIKAERDYERLKHTAQMLYEKSDYDDVSSTDAFEFVRRMKSEGFKAICARMKKPPFKEGEFEPCPFVSAAELVEEVAEKQGVSAEAAGLYLQFLTLPDPTTANVKTWNGWTTAQVNKAAKELASKQLILEAKRARAGRAYFLPGGWEALKLPHLPIESWKLPLYEIGRSESQQLEIPLGLILPLQPVHELFHKAWQRIQEGDQPRYEDVS